MIIIELLAPGRAIVFREPSLLARVLLGRASSARSVREVLVITGGWKWAYDDTSHRVEYVEPDVVAALERAVRDERRPRMFRALEPPG